MNVGVGTYGAEHIVCNSYGVVGSSLTVGNYCSIAPNIKVMLGGNHQHNRVTTYPFNIRYGFGSGKIPDGYSNGNVTIGNDVWLGQDVTIMSGITVGNGSIVAAGTVVTKDVAPYNIVGGNPMKVIRVRFTSEQIQQLQEIAWWDWSIDRIKRNAELMLYSSIDDFILHHVL